MIHRDMLTGYGERNGRAVVAFSDGRELQIVPQWRGDSVSRIAAVVLLADGAVVAVATDRGFWTSAQVTQPELGAYCAFAMVLERQVYRFYREKRIDESTWQQTFRAFWKIAIKCRQMARVLQAGQLPTLTDQPEVAAA